MHLYSISAKAIDSIALHTIEPIQLDTLTFDMLSVGEQLGHIVRQPADYNSIGRVWDQCAKAASARNSLPLFPKKFKSSHSLG